MPMENCKTRIVPQSGGYRIQVKKWVWSAPFLSPFDTWQAADEFRRAEWPGAQHLGGKFVKVPIEFVSAYTTAALWSSVDDDGVPLEHGRDQTDIASETMFDMIEDCRLFWEQCQEQITCDGGPTGPDGSTQIEMAGHDFWLTRCGHGAGFWDGDWPEPHAQKLTDAAEAFGNVDLYIGDDGKVWA